jgi:aromatic ring-opening dioxygenase LigB subunit
VPLAIGRSVADENSAHENSVPWVLQGVACATPVPGCQELGAALAARPRRTALLVVADGSARRGEKAPGYIDSRAADLDADIARSLGDADPGALLSLDAELCAELLVAGRAAWQVMAAACAGTSWSARMVFAGHPFGVSYWVLTWLRS